MPLIARVEAVLARFEFRRSLRIGAGGEADAIDVCGSRRQRREIGEVVVAVEVLNEQIAELEHLVVCTDDE